MSSSFTQDLEINLDDSPRTYAWTLQRIGALKEEIEKRERNKRPVHALLFALDMLIEHATHTSECLSDVDIGDLTMH